MADTRIKDLATFSGTPTATDFLAIDGPNETKKIPGNMFALVDSNGGVNVRNQLDIAENPNHRQSKSIIICRDKNGKTLSSIVVSKETNGQTSLILGVGNVNANGSDIYTWPAIFLSRDGATTYTIPSPANFRSAIDVGGQFITERKSATVINAENKKDYQVTIDCTKQGYTPIGIVGLVFEGDFYTNFHAMRQFVSGNNAYVGVRANTETAFVSPLLTVSAYVLYKRNA